MLLATRAWRPFLESPETFRVHFGWHNSPCIFKTKASRDTNLGSYLNFYSLNKIGKEQLYRISGSGFYEWLFGPKKFSGLSRNGPLNGTRTMTSALSVQLTKYLNAKQVLITAKSPMYLKPSAHCWQTSNKPAASWLPFSNLPANYCGILKWGTLIYLREIAEGVESLLVLTFFLLLKKCLIIHCKSPNTMHVSFFMQRLAATYGESRRGMTQRDYKRVNISRAWYVQCLLTKIHGLN